MSVLVNLNMESDIDQLILWQCQDRHVLYGHWLHVTVTSRGMIGVISQGENEVQSDI